MNHFWREKGWRGGSQETRARRGKKPFPATFIFYFIRLETFQERKKKSFFILQIFIFLFAQQPQDFPNSQKAAAVPGLAPRASCFEVCARSRCWGDPELAKQRTGLLKIYEPDLLAQTPLNSRGQPGQLHVPSHWKGL